ncbi:hypothetical protein LZZ90_10360 [Flavobacterium sp. SM15]|uniref:hypothetical protein n=1 Tax=Flavobacterium sp. SM15 TaxID=2908005 RepID=UPI001EDC214B|nr:hypothetical protein [Flavobacterium sp. SM15]MCG2611908.1 hypothetical protein [Flavobacterium sp. SM15]
MKNFFTLIYILCVFNAFSQEINMEKGKFYQQGKQISSYETKQLLMSNPEALKYFKQGKTKEGIGGFMLGLGIGLTVGDLVKGLVSDVDYPSGMTYVGAAAIVASIPIMAGKKKKIKKGIELYNQGLKPSSDTGNSTDFNMAVIANNYGYGLQIRF